MCKRMKASDLKIFINGIILAVIHFCVYFSCMYIADSLWGKFGTWKTCKGYDHCAQEEQLFYNAIYFYEVRMLLMLIATFVFTYFIYKKHNHNYTKAAIVSLSLSLVWLPAVWFHLGQLRPYTLETVVSIILGGIVAILLLRNKHITSSSTPTVNP